MTAKQDKEQFDKCINDFTSSTNESDYMWLSFEDWKMLRDWFKEAEGKLNPFRIYRDE